MVNLHVDSTYFRFGLRVYFVVAVLLAALVGDLCCHLQTKLRLLKGHAATVADMTGWLRGFSSWLAALRLRRLPGGWIGAVMLFTALLAIGADFGTAFVTYVALQSKCSFSTGLVLNATAAHYYPSYFDAAYRWASSAQLNSIANGGLMGIYEKADNSTLFSADKDDTLGNWVCSTTANSVDYTNYSDLEVWEDLHSKGLLYEVYDIANVSSDTHTSSGLQSSGVSRQLFIMTTNVTNNGEMWDLAVAVDLLDDPESDTKTMQTYLCQVQARDAEGAGAISDIMVQIDIAAILPNWVFGFQGALYNGLTEYQAVQYPHVVIEWMLNSMVMVSGSGESIVSQAPLGSVEGCIYYGTYLPVGVLFLIVLTGFVAAGLMFYAVFLWFYVRIARSNYDRNHPNASITAKDICDGAPNGLLDWISHSAYASNHHVTKTPAYRRLSSWHLSTKHHGGQRMAVVEAGQQASPTSATFSPLVSSPTTNTTAGSTPVMQQQGYFDQKTGYAAVHTQEMPRY